MIVNTKYKIDINIFEKYFNKNVLFKNYSNMSPMLLKLKMELCQQT